MFWINSTIYYYHETSAQVTFSSSSTQALVSADKVSPISKMMISPHSISIYVITNVII